eukprot:m.58258 g.58258  ORF g.58258 m.58258 type:complete len:216 (+) comp7856_c0_seq1:27-674(+)
MAGRGLLIVFEGIDRCGKSTQVSRLVDSLNKMREGSCKRMQFPDRSTAIGGMINQYLKKEIELDDHSVHLLFSANRWELVNEMKKELQNGTTLIIDRYAFSGVAFTSAKGMDMDWCKSPDAGLPHPDLFFHFVLNEKEAESRGGFGDERYEVSDFQKKVKAKYSELYESMTKKPIVLDVSGQSIEEVEEVVKQYVDDAFTKLNDLEPVDKMDSLW